MSSAKNVKIHPSAIVAPSAELAEGVEIGPYSIIGPNVRIGRMTRISNAVVVEGKTTIGERCLIHTGACLGTAAQVKKEIPFDTFLKIGNDNVIREYVTMNPAIFENQSTVIGDRNFFMIGCHVAHDCRIGSDIVIANTVALAGHVTVEDRVVMGGSAAVHQFTRIGTLSIVGGLSKVIMDVPPYSMCDGHPARFYGLNAIGLRRAGYSAERMKKVKDALKILLSSLKRAQALEDLKARFKDDADVGHLIEFAKNSKRGLCRRVLRSHDDVVE